MAKISELIFRMLGIWALILFSGCANQLPPGGGDIDTVPPQILESFPVNGTVNFKENYIEVTFSEYVDKRSVQDAIFFSPALQKSMVYDWSGKSLTINFQEALKENTTYTVSVGTDVKDLHNGNNMAESFTFAFSTGNKIDKGKIAGRIYDRNSEGVMIFAYRVTDKESDPSKESPDYISQVGKNGKFTLLGLAEGDYKVFAIKDKMRDGKYQKNEDEYGAQFMKTHLAESINELNEIDFFLTREDTIVPVVSNVIMKDRNHLLVEFTDKIDSTKLSTDNFYLVDSTAGRKVVPGFIFKGDAKPYQFYLGLKDTLEKIDGWVLVSQGIKDFANNISAIEKNPVTVKNDRDTISLKPLRLTSQLSGDKIDYEFPEITLSFNDAIDAATLIPKLSVVDAKGTSYLVALQRIDDALFNVVVASKLKQSTEYTLKIDLKNYYDFSGNKVDSLFNNKFTTANELDFSGVSGNIITSDTTQTIIMLESAESLRRTYKQKADEKKKFDFKKIVPGKYLVWGYKDRNKNDKYDYGSIIPFKYSEEFRYYPDTLNLRARWPVGGVSVDFQK